MKDNLGRADFLALLIRLQRMACSYFSPGPADKPTTRCDCKFGATKLMEGSETGSGCPELRHLINLVEVMTPAEWERLEVRLMKTRRSQHKVRMKLLDNVVERAAHLHTDRKPKKSKKK
jgi:hypothetical protein